MNLHYSPLEEGNRIIAEFMGFKFDAGKKDALKFYKGSNKDGWKSKSYVNPTYHSSWDWLMPVAEKIEKMGYDSRIHGNNSDGGFICDFVDDENAEWGCAVTHSTKIEAVWLAVIDFIKYYNEQNPKP